MAGRDGSAFPYALALVTLASAGALQLALTRSSAGPDAGIHGRVVLTEGEVRYAGTPPVGETLDMSADPYCRERHASPVVDRPVRVGEDGGLADVLVFVRDAPRSDAAPEDEVLLDQVDCLYTPGVVAVRTGQTLTIRNSDETLHNVRVTPEINRGFNLGQPIPGIESRRSFGRPETGIPVRCDIHGWMHATLHVLDHGFFAVTGPDGRFQLPELPAGDYEIEARHPTLGTSSQTVTVPAGQTPTVHFEFGA